MSGKKPNIAFLSLVEWMSPTTLDPSCFSLVLSRFARSMSLKTGATRSSLRVSSISESTVLSM